MIENNGIIYLLNREDEENTKMYLDRCWFVANSNPKKPSEINNKIKMSKFYRNVKHYGVKYLPEIQSEIMRNHLMNIPK